MNDIRHFSSVSQLTRALGLPAPSHPLIALVDYGASPVATIEKGVRVSLDLYKISFKNSFKGQVRYGQGYYDFEEGGLAFLKPQQIVTSYSDASGYEGFALYFHPDLIRNYPLGSAIHGYGFFSYDVSEALCLSADEKGVIAGLLDTIGKELKQPIDGFSQDILVSHIELLLNYSNRYYNRQFITRKSVNHEIVASLDRLLYTYFGTNRGLKEGLPSVHYVSAELKLSQRYLSDMLRWMTGMNTQQYIQNKVIEQSKDLLSATALSVSEIAYHLGFEHPQSFSKLFRAKTGTSPLGYRQGFN